MAMVLCARRDGFPLEQSASDRSLEEDIRVRSGPGISIRDSRRYRASWLVESALTQSFSI
jgi:hypothetical protein